MIKNMLTMALATMSVAAMAQTDTTSKTTTTTTTEYQTNTHSWNKDREMDMNWSDQSMWSLRKHVEWHAGQVLSGGDKFVLATMLDRAPTSVELSILKGLTGARKQAVMINDRMLAMRFPADTTITTTTTADNSGVTKTTKVTADNDMSAQAMNMADDSQSRPMRMAMSRSSSPKEINYLDAVDILSSNLDSTESATLQDWWFYRASERQKDVLVRLLKDDAGISSQIYYPSVYTHRTYSWISMSDAK